MGSKFSRIACALAGGLLVLATASNASAADKQRVAVKAFAAKGVDPATAATLESQFCTSFPTDNYDILCSDDVKNLAAHKQQEMGFGKCDDDEACTKQISQITEASRVITGEISKLGDLYIVTVTLVDPANNKVLSRATDKANKLEDLLGKLEGIAKKIASAK